jgi:Fe-S cluster assembly iron-binding protein IscA
MITLTENARTAIRRLTAPEQCGLPPGAGMRIAATEGQPEHRGLDLGLAVTARPEPVDEVVDDQGARVFLEPGAARTLGEQTLDARFDQTHHVEFFVLVEATAATPWSGRR